MTSLTQKLTQRFLKKLQRSHLESSRSVTLCSEEPGASQSSSSSVRSDDTFILNLTVYDPHKEVATGEGSQPKRPCRINCEAKALIEKILTSKAGGERIMQENEKNKTLTDATRRQVINILAAEMTETHGTTPPEKCRGDVCTGDSCIVYLS
ncbi:hypothetical protein AOLI_G00180770 [Acnodon oligacanthus]